MTNVKLLIILSIACYCSFSCNKKTSVSKPETFIMPKRMEADKHDRKDYYAPYNFIVDTSSTIYFFQQEPEFRTCGTVMWWEEIRIPVFIDLKPKDLVDVPISNIEEFVQLNILRKDWRKVVISSPFDTISSESLSRLMKIFKDTSNHVRWEFRKCTQEEKFVLKYKKLSYDYYDHGTLKWDSTKTLFREVINEVIDEDNNLLLTSPVQVDIKKISDNRYLSSMILKRDSMCFEKVAKKLNVKVDYLFDFEL